MVVGAVVKSILAQSRDLFNGQINISTLFVFNYLHNNHVSLIDDFLKTNN